MEKSLRKGTLRMNLVLGLHEGECCPDTKISQKADEDHYHDAEGDTMLRIQGFPHCEVGGSIGSGKHTEVKSQSQISSSMSKS